MALGFNPYINFQGNAREAIEFYRDVFGGELTLQTFGEMNPAAEPAEAQKVMHAQLEAPNGIVLMVSDTPAGMGYQPGTNVSISLSGDDEQQLREYFEKLSAGGTVGQPLETAPWGDTFGMFTDRFGIGWLVNIAGGASR